MQSIATHETPSGFGRIASGEVEFRCLNPDDPALQHPVTLAPPGRLLFAIAMLLSGCAGTMLPGRMYALPAGRTLPFSIETSRGNGRMEASDPETGERFNGEYSGFYKGQETVLGSLGGHGVALFKLPTGANAQGILVGNKGTTIRLYFEINPGLRPTGYGVGADQSGNQYEVYF